jgi:ssRNA-specific RNase YbeY (16S rRNA maturation enzyme)
LHLLGMDHEQQQERNEMESMEDLIMSHIAHEKIQKP